MVTIDPNKPLPDHSKLDYDECCAKLILEELFPERYNQLVLSDKPDLQGNEVGIEVTNANDPKTQEALSNWIKANCATDTVKKNQYIERMAQLGVTYTGAIQSWPGELQTFQWTEDAVKRKIEKLKSGIYEYFPRYELFVFTDTWFYEDIVDQARDFFFSEVVCPWYKTIYVLSEGLALHTFETDTQEYSYLQIDTAKQTDRNYRARRMVEEGEQE